MKLKLKNWIFLKTDRFLTKVKIINATHIVMELVRNSTQTLRLRNFQY